MLKFLYLFSIYLFSFFTINSCNSLQKVKESNHETMNTPKITPEDLAKVTPTKISTKDGYKSAYSVIIYTDDISSLKNQGILVQSESNGFVTAFIEKEDLEKLYQNKSVRSIQLPQTDYPTQEKIIN